MSEQLQHKTGREDRGKRVKRLKKIIVIVLFILILLPSVFCIFLFTKMNRVEQQLEELLQVRLLQSEEKVENEILAATPKESAAVKAEEESQAETNQSEEAKNKDAYKVYLTFDDGPSTYTDEILDILKEYQVKATFFVVGKEEEQYKSVYRRIVKEGHTLGLHSYSHDYKNIYQSVPAFTADMEKLQNFLYRTTGVRSTMLRFPGGSSNEVSQIDMQELFTYVQEKGITYFDWNISSGDAAKGMRSAQTILKNCTEPLGNRKTSVILMHDASDKRTTVEALPLIIEKILEQENTVILPITEETEPVQHIKMKEK